MQNCSRLVGRELSLDQLSPFHNVFRLGRDAAPRRSRSLALLFRAREQLETVEGHNGLMAPRRVVGGWNNLHSSRQLCELQLGAGAPLS